MTDIQRLLDMARSQDKKERKRAAEEFRKLDFRYPEVVSVLEELTQDKDRGVRKEAEKSLNELQKKPEPEPAVQTEGGTEGTAFDDTVGDTSLEAGEYDVESSLSIEEEQAIDEKYEGQGLVVEIKETEKMVLDSNGTLQEKSECEGELVVLNNGSKDRIFGIDLKIEGYEGVNQKDDEPPFASTMSIVDLDPRETWKKHYSFTTPEEPISVRVRYYDPQTNLLPNFLGKDELEFVNEIEITNTTDSPIENVRIVKFVSPNGRVHEATSSKGEVSAEEDKVILTVGSMEPNETVTLKIDLVGTVPESQESYEAGQIIISYDSPGKLFSGLNFVGIDGVSNHRQSLRRVEREEEPGVYDCVVYFENRSEFPYDLNTLKVFEGDIANQTLVLDWDGRAGTEEEREVQPGEKVAFEFAFEYDGEGAPTFGRIVDFTVQHQAKVYTHTELTIPAEKLKFMAIAVTKNYGIDKVPSYTRTPIPTKIEVIGVGTYPLEAVEVKDTIPEGFEAPKPEEIEILFNGQKLEEGFVIEGDAIGNEDLSHPRYLVFKFEHLESNDLIQGFKENDRLEFSYPVTVIRPTKDAGILKGAVVAEGYVYANPDQKVVSVADDEIQGVEVVHERIAIDVAKELLATTTPEGKGYQITLFGENFGNKPVTFTLKDLIPKGFRLVGETHEEPPVKAEDVQVSDEGVEKMWTFENVGPNEEVKVVYTIVGEGTYNPRDAQVLAQG
ncbi:MAG: hypothetical protein D6732_20190 [Methanobacteriota archaeon]|nr:MAG: hypothetical protein D6732_20190 [Euryarchaeota archaeon]